MSQLNHPILKKSFAIIDREIGEHHFSPEQYAIARRVIHATADFEFAELLRFSPGAIEAGIACLRQQVPIITDVSMVKQGIATLVAKTFYNPIVVAVEQASVALLGKTRTETGLLRCIEQYPQGIYVIGNAPTALLALCAQSSAGKGSGSEAVFRSEVPSELCPGCFEQAQSERPSLIIGAPVGFVSVIESKQALAQSSVPNIRVEGRKGGSAVAAAILNALLVLAWE